MTEATHKPTKRSPRLLLWLIIALLFLILLCILLWNIFKPPLPGSAPVADANGPYSLNEGETLTLDGSGSAGTGLTYQWVFGDGDTGTGESPSHTYNDGPTELTVTLTVTDGGGRSNTDSTQVTVHNLPPTADAGGPYTCGLGETIQITGECDDPSPVDAETLTCSWADFSGAMSNDPGYHCPNTPGEIMLTLTATDKDGASAQDTTTVTVSDTPPEPTVTPDPNGEPTVTPTPGENVAPEAVIEIYLMSKNGLKYGFNGSGSSDSDGDIVSYDWNFGDTYTATGVEVVHEYAQDGNYIITLIVTDDDGAMGEATKTIP